MSRPGTALAALLLLGARSTGGAEPAAVEIEDYVVQPGDSCSGIAHRRFGNSRRYDLIHQHNALGPPPHSLRPGQVLRLPRGSTGPDARLTFIHKDVLTYTPERHPGKLDEPLDRSNKVGTLADSAAEITFRDLSQLQLSEHTLVVIYGQGQGEVAPATGGTDLMTGTLRAHMAALAGLPPERRLALSTPSAQVTLGAGEAQVHVDEKRTTRLAVYHGRSRLRAAGRTVAVPELFGSRADRGRSPTPPRPLPPVPKWTSAPPPLALTRGDAVDLAGGYEPGTEPGPAAVRWRVQVARDPRFNDLMLDARVPVDVIRFEARGLRPGRYFARVSAIDADQFEGPYSAAAETQVVLAALVPGGEGHRAALQVAADVYCGLDGAPMQQHGGKVELAPAQPHTLRCALTADGPSTSVSVSAPESGPAAPTVVAAGTPASAPTPASAAPIVIEPPRRVHFEVGLVESLLFLERGALGAGVGLELGPRVRLGGGAVALAVRPTYLHLAEAGPRLVLGFPLSYRHGAPGSRLGPYLTLLPQLYLGQDPSAGRPVPSIEARFALGGLAGCLFWVQRGGPFIELGYQHVFGGRTPGFGAFSGFFGYRLVL